MKRIGTFLSIVAVLLLGACASPITSDCAKDSICPILIYEKFPGYFATYPDTLMVQSGDGGQQTVVWTFADASKYKFVASTDTVKGDGVELIGANGSKIGMTSCFVTKRSRLDFRPAKEGPYYRCEIVSGSKFAPTRYIVRFRTMDGSPRMVDPGLGATGSGHDDDPDGVYPPLPLFNAGDSVALPVKPAGIDGYRVIWDSASGALFRRADTPMVFKDDATPPKEIDIQPCTPSTTADGKTAAPEGRYYTCIFTTPLKPLAFTYDARYTDSSSTIQTRAGNVTRAP